MTMARSLPYLAALVLGAGTAALASCADGGPKAGVPASAASDLKSQLDDVRGVVESAKCRGLARELAQVRSRIDGLPSSVDPQLQQRLSDGYDRLKSKAPKECKSNHDATTTTTTETQTAPQTQTQPQTQPPPRTQPQTQPPPQTQTQSTPASPPPVTTPNPPDPSGGTPPQSP